MKPKKTLYDLLEVSPFATDHEIHSAYSRLAQQLDAGVHGLAQEEAEIERKSLRQAYETLINSKTRSAYNECLAMDGTSASSNNLDLVKAALRTEVTAKEVVWAPIRVPLTAIAIIMTIGMVTQIGFVLVTYTRAHFAMSDPEARKNEATRKAEEKLILQEYFHKTGIRAKDKVEMELLEADRRRNEDALRTQTYEQREQERKYQEFVEDGRRRGEEVSQNLRTAEEAARREEEYKQRQREEEERIRLEKP